MHVSSSAGTEAQLIGARARVCLLPPGQGGLEPSREDGIRGVRGTPGHAPHPGSPLASDLNFLPLSTS